MLDTANPDFSNQPTVNRTTDLTIEILPPKDLLQQVTDAWNTGENAINGFAGLAIAILTIGSGGIGDLVLSNQRF